MTDLTTAAPADAGNVQPNTGNEQIGATQTENTTAFTFAEELQSNPSIQKFKGDPNKLAESYLNLERLMGQGRVVIPKDENDKVAWDAYNKAFEVPENSEDYNLKAADGIDLKDFKDIMKANHISPTVAQKLLDAHLGAFEQLAATQKQEAETAKQEAEKSLKAEWGAKYVENIKQARTSLEKMCADKEEFDYFNEKIGNDPKFIKLLARMGEAISEGSLGGFEGQVSGFNRTPAEAKAEFDRIMSDPNDAFWAGSRNKRNDPAWCKKEGQHFVSQEERKARVDYVNSLMMQMQG